MTWHRYDKVGKWLIHHFADALPRVAGESGVVSCHPHPCELVQPGQLPDGLLHVRREGQSEPVRYLIELGTKAEPRLTRWMERGMMLVYLNFGELPEGLAFILSKRGKYRLPPGTEVRSESGGSSLRLAWRTIELWTLPADSLLAANDVGVVPWVPLTDFRETPEMILGECRRRIDEQAPEHQRDELLVVTQVMAQLRFTDPELLNLLGGSQMIFESELLDRAVKKVVKERMKAAQERIRKAQERKMRKALEEKILENTVLTHREDILSILRTRFGKQPRDVSKSLDRISDSGKLKTLVEVAASCPDLDAFRSELSA